jgi:hypothetical protein
LLIRGARSVQQLVVEGSGKMHTQFLTGNLVDEPGSHHITFSFMAPDVSWALLGLPGVVLMLVPTARSAPSFRVRG